jgi:magnesium-transporting ATPase (P-type)
MRGQTEQNRFLIKESTNGFLSPTTTLVIKMLLLAVIVAFIFTLALIVLINYVAHALLDTYSPSIVTTIIIVVVMFSISLIGLIMDIVRERNFEKQLAELRKMNNNFFPTDNNLNFPKQDATDE